MVGDENPPESSKVNILTENETPEKVECFQSSVNASVSAIDEAARWLVLSRATIVGAVIPALRAKFGLGNIDAIEATKRAHALQYGERP